MRKLNRQEVVRKAITVFEAIRRMTSKSGAGLEPERGAEEEYNMVDDCTQQLREIMREMQQHDNDRELQRQVQERYEESLRSAQDDNQARREMKPLTAIGHDDRDYVREYPKEREWQNEIRMAGGPPERMTL